MKSDLSNVDIRLSDWLSLTRELRDKENRYVQMWYRCQLRLDTIRLLSCDQSAPIERQAVHLEGQLLSNHFNLLIKVLFLTFFFLNISS